MRKFTVYSLQFTVLLMLLLYPVTYNLFPIHAQVDIGKEYAFGDIKSLGEGTDRLVGPTFSIATVAVVMYFLFGAFKILTAGADKEAMGNARNMITHAIIGFVILMFAFLILQFLLSSLFGIKDFQIIQTN